jgi:hypothetical protein
MRFLSTLVFLLCLVGCSNHLILREPVPHEKYQSGRTGTLYEGTSFWEISRAVSNNGPKPGSKIRKKGTMTFSSRKYRENFDFTYQYNDKHDWHVIFFKKGVRKFSLHYNKLGLTFQEVTNEIFIQSDPDLVWEELEDHLYLHSLKTVTDSLHTPGFDHTKDWIAEVDGLKYFVIARALKMNEQDLKEELYFHKKSHSLRRKLKTTMNTGIVEDVTFRSYKDTGNAYMPHSVIVQMPTQAERVDIHFDSIEIEEQAEPVGQLKEL